MNRMLCDLKTGICGEAGEASEGIIDFSRSREKVDLYYVTDPICSHCWALEPVLRRFEAQYGPYVKFHTVMGGLLKSWDGFADVKNGIGSPADVAGHWKEVGKHARMPIDGSLWLTDPIRSSYPPSRVFKVIQRQVSGEAARTFLRRAREAVFVFNRNIGDAAVLADVVNQMGLDGKAVVKEAEEGSGQTWLEQDFALAGSLGVRGFPTVIIVNRDKKGVRIVGARPLSDYVDALKQVLPNETVQARPVPDLQHVLDKEGLLFSKELEVLYDLAPDAVRSYVRNALPADAYTDGVRLGEYYVEKK